MQCILYSYYLGKGSLATYQSISSPYLPHQHANWYNTHFSDSANTLQQLWHEWSSHEFKSQLGQNRPPLSGIMSFPCFIFPLVSVFHLGESNVACFTTSIYLASSWQVGEKERLEQIGHVQSNEGKTSIDTKCELMPLQRGMPRGIWNSSLDQEKRSSISHLIECH